MRISFFDKKERERYTNVPKSLSNFFAMTAALKLTKQFNKLYGRTNIDHFTTTCLWLYTKKWSTWPFISKFRRVSLKWFKLNHMLLVKFLNFNFELKKKGKAHPKTLPSKNYSLSRRSCAIKIQLLSVFCSRLIKGLFKFLWFFQNYLRKLDWPT